MVINRLNKLLIVPTVALLTIALALSSCGTSTPTPTPSPTPASPTASKPPVSSTPIASPPPASSTAPAPSASPTPAPTGDLVGAGATFPAPLYAKWFDVYSSTTGIKVNYQAVGSGAGINQITAGTVDFAGSDAIMTADQQSKAEAVGGSILHIPMTSGAVVVIYNLQGIASEQIKLTGDILANIYLKKITKWNDPAITALNPGLNLPNTPIAVVHRSDGSGTSYIFTNYLSRVSSVWNSTIGFATAVNWPGDIGGSGNAGVAGSVQQTPGAIGYVELAYAEQNKLPWVLLKNAAGNYQKPSLDGVTKATVGVALPDDMKVMITNSTNPDAYPIAGYTWILAYVNQTNKNKGTLLVNMLWWAIHDGQQYGISLDYAPLSSDAVKKAEAEILSIKYQGQPLRAP